MNKLIFKGWYEDTPESWEVKRMKNIMNVRKDVSKEGKEELLSVTIKEGIEKRSEYLNEDVGRSRAESLVGYKKVSPNNLVNNIMKMSFKCLGVSKYEGIVSPAYSVFTLDESQIYPPYLHYLLRNSRYIYQYRILSRGIQESRLRLYDDYFLAMKVVLPSKGEQEQISNYLNLKITTIEKIIKLSNKKILLLKEQEKTNIYYYVISGIKDNIEKKNTSYPWIDSVPKNWKLIRLKYLLESREEKSTTGEEELLSVTIKNGIVKRKDYIGEDEEHISRAETLVGYKKVYKNDLVNNIMKMSFYCLGVSEFEGIVSPAYSVFKINQKLLIPRYLHLLLRLPSLVCEYRKRSRGIQESKLRLYDDYFLDITVPVPSLEEQELILQRISKITNPQILLEEKRIELLVEYKNSLINSLCSGKIRIGDHPI